MPTRQTRPPAESNAEGLAEVPGFRQPASPDQGPHPDELSPTPEPSATSSRSEAASPSSPTDAPGDPSRSTTASTEVPDLPPPPPPAPLSAELEEELENLAGGLFELGGMVMNRVSRARRPGIPSRLWLVSEQEAEDFGAAAGRIAGRRVPEELKSGDGADVLIMGSVLLGYGMRNVSGVTVPEPAGGGAGSPTTAEPPPTPPPAAGSVSAPPAAPPPPPHAASSRAGGPVVVGVEEGTPPPPDVISPEL